MGTATQNISIRIAVLDGDKSIRTLNLTGDAATRAFKRINEATAPASRSLSAVNVVGEQVKHGLEGLAEGSGSLGTSLIRLGPAGLAAAAAIGAVGLVVSESIKKFIEAEQAVNSLNACSLFIFSCPFF